MASSRLHTVFGLLGSGITTTVVGLVFTMLFARMAVPAEFGLYSAALAFAQVYGAMIEFGMSIEINRTTNTHALATVVSDALRIVFVVVACVICLAMCFCGMSVWSGVSLVSSVYMLALEILALVWIAARTISANYVVVSVVSVQDVKVIGTDIAGVILAHALAVCGMMVVHHYGQGYLSLIALGVFAVVECGKVARLHRLIMSADSAPPLQHPLRIAWRICVHPLDESRFAFRAMRARIALLLVQVLSSVEQRWGIVMAGQSLVYGSYEAVALFSAPYRLINALRFGIGVLQKTLLREFSIRQTLPAGQQFWTLKKSLVVISSIISGLMIFVGIQWYADTIIVFVYGAQYVQAGAVLRWQMWLLPAQTLAIVAESYLLAHGQERLVAVLLAIEIVVMSVIAVWGTMLWHNTMIVSSQSLALMVSQIAVMGMMSVGFVLGSIALLRARRISQ